MNAAHFIFLTACVDDSCVDKPKSFTFIYSRTIDANNSVGIW